MNYRHVYHAGNFADVIKHALMVQIIRCLQSKDTALLLLDTHAGRGAYNLNDAAQGDSLARTPEWPEGIGRILSAGALSPTLEDYRRLVLEARDPRSNRALPDATEHSYPGSPWLMRMLAREQDALAFCELHQDEYTALTDLCGKRQRQSIQLLDGYKSLEALLPPPNRRAFVLVDPPYEAQDEFIKVVDGLRAAYSRFNSGTVAVWYPITERARIDEFYADLANFILPACWTAEITVVGPNSPKKLKGCGLLVFNPPWRLDSAIKPVCAELAALLAQEPGASANFRWVVEEL